MNNVMIIKLQVLIIPLLSSVGAMVAFQHESDVCNLDYNFWAICDMYANSAHSIRLYSLAYRNKAPNEHQEELINRLLKQYADRIPVTVKKYLLSKNYTAGPISKQKRNIVREESELILSNLTRNDTFKRHKVLIITIAPNPKLLIGAYHHFNNYKFFRELIVLFFLENLEEDYLQELLKSYWSHRVKVLTTAAFTPCYSGFLYIHDPFYLKKNNKNGVIKKLRFETVLKYHIPIENNVHNLHGYKIRISMFERQLTAHRLSPTRYTGTDGDFLHTLSNHMNFTPIFVEPTDDTFGDFLPNGTATGSLRHVIDGTCDMAGNSRFLIDTDKVYFSIPPQTESICVVVPKAVRIPSWLEIVKVFSWKLWGFILVCFMVCVWFRYLFHWLNGGTPLDSTVFLESVAILFGVAFNFRRRGQHLLILILIVFNLIFGNLLQSNLSNIFTARLSDKEIDTVEGLLAADLPIITNLKVLVNDPTETMQKLRTKQILNPKHTKRYVDVCKYRNLSTLDRETNVQIMLRLMKDEHGDVCLHQMRDCLADFTLSYLVQKTSPYLVEINKVIFVLTEGGFVEYWRRKSTEHFAKNYTMEKTDFRALTIGHFNIAFCTLFSGYVVSFLVFLWEVLRK